MWLLLFYVSSSWCSVLVCGMLLWHFLSLVTFFIICPDEKVSDLYLFNHWGSTLFSTLIESTSLHYDLISNFQVGLKSLLCQGLLETEFYGDLVYRFKKIVGSNNFSALFIKIISHYKKIGCNMNVLQQTACLVFNPLTVGNFAFFFNCTPVGRTSDSMTVLTLRLIFLSWGHFNRGNLDVCKI